MCKDVILKRLFALKTKNADWVPFDVKDEPALRDANVYGWDSITGGNEC